MKPINTLRAVGRPVAFYPSLSKHVGGTKACLFLCQLMYWSDKTSSDLGVYKSSNEWEEETGLSYKEQATARKELVKRGLIVETHKRLEHRIYFKFNDESFDSMIMAIHSTSNSRNADRAVGGVPNDTFDHTENTTETTTENKPYSSEVEKTTTDKQVSKVISDAAIQTPKGEKWGGHDDLKAAQWIYQKVLITSPTAKEPNWTAWANDIRLMRQRDNRTHREICAVFEWASKDSFWCTNVLSPATLRKQWDKLTAQMMRPASRQHGSGMIDPEDTSWINDDWGF